MLKVVESRKLNLHNEIYHEEPNPCKSKNMSQENRTHVRSIMVEIQNKICPRHELEKSNPHKKIHHGIGTKNIPKAHELRKPNSCKEICHYGGTKQNMPKMHELEKIDLHEISVMIKTQGKICPKRMSRKNMTYIRRNLLRWKRRTIFLRHASQKNPTHERRSQTLLCRMN